MEDTERWVRHHERVSLYCVLCHVPVTPAAPLCLYRMELQTLRYHRERVRFGRHPRRLHMVPRQSGRAVQRMVHGLFRLLPVGKGRWEENRTDRICRRCGSSAPLVVFHLEIVYGREPPYGTHPRISILDTYPSFNYRGSGRRVRRGHAGGARIFQRLRPHGLFLRARHDYGRFLLLARLPWGTYRNGEKAAEENRHRRKPPRRYPKALGETCGQHDVPRQALVRGRFEFYRAC